MKLDIAIRITFVPVSSHVCFTKHMQYVHIREIYYMYSVHVQ